MKESNRMLIGLLVSALWLAGRHGYGQDATNLNVQIAGGWDFRLAPSIAPAARSGLFYMDQIDIDSDAQTALGRTFTWADLNPAEDVYDFKALHSALGWAQDRGLKVVLRLKGLVTRKRRRTTRAGMYEGPFVPGWVLAKHKPAEFVTLDRDGMYLRVAAPWDPGLHAEYLKFVRRFGDESLLANPALAGLYVHGFSSSGGEEFWLDRHGDYIVGAEGAGMTEPILVETFRERLSAWADAAGTNVSKIAWVDAGPIQARRWDVAKLNEHARNLGMGWRQGGIENFHRHWYPQHGQTVSNGYVTVDWNHPLRDGRYFGQEGERDDLWRAESAAVRNYCTRSMVFRAAQLGINHCWFSKSTYRDDPPLWRWFSRVAGKGPATSPDAICWLREDRVIHRSRGPEPMVWKNIERFLYQRDHADGYSTVACMKQVRPALSGDVAGEHFDYAARRTDVVQGEHAMQFFFDRPFVASQSGAFRILLTYPNDTTNSWVIRVATPAGILQSEPIHNSGEGGVWTASLAVPGIAPDGTLPHGAQIEARVTDGGDLTLQFVRVVRAEAY